MKKNRKKVVKKSKSTLTKSSKENSTITFEIDKELKVVIHSKINKDIVTSLIDKGYMNAADAENEPLIQVAFVLLASDVAEQILSEVSGKKDGIY